MAADPLATGSRHHGIWYRLRESGRQSLHVYIIRFGVAFTRYVLFAGLLRRWRTFDTTTGAVGENTISHNRKGVRDLAVSRSLVLIRPIVGIDKIAHRIESVDVLCVGPRTEGELLNLMAHGFSTKRVRGIDLISYSPWVDLGDMHAMPYAEDRWDVVILAWVLAYSNDPQKAADEVLRVARDGAVIAIGVEHRPASMAEVESELGYRPGGDHRIETTDEMLAWFGESVDRVYLRHDVEPETRAQLGAVYTVFSVTKA